jgi:RNA polymerase sigma-70 factor (ECF subfamily)
MWMTGQHVPAQTDDSALRLIQAMAAGNTQALNALYERFGSAILSFLVARLGDQQLAEEVLQDVMLAAWENAATFRGESKVFTWLLVIARNRAMNAQRHHVLPSVSLDDEFESGTTDSGLFEVVARKATSAAVRAALRTLPPAQRELLVLVFYHQLSGPEIARVLGITIGTVKSRLHRAKEALRRALTAEGSA